MKKDKTYWPVYFDAAAVQQLVARWTELCQHPQELRLYLNVTIDNETWYHGTLAEFLADYRRGPSGAVLQYETLGHSLRLQLVNYRASEVSVEMASRADIESLYGILEENRARCTIRVEEAEPTVVLPKIFIGHGHDPQWRDLKDHLSEKHGLQVIAYEIGAGAGHTIRDTLTDMLDRSSFAVLLMTGEDQGSDGSLRARQNVIHEIGLFQGRLGFARAIVLVEDGTEMFSNLHGVEQIRFGNIKEAFGEVLATIRREFG